MAASNIQVNISRGSENVDILVDGSKGIEHNFDKMLKINTIPKQDPPLTLVIDLKMLKEIITINGYLEDTTAIDALTKKATLRSILQKNGTCTLAWGSGATAQSYSGIVLKGSIKELSGKVGDEGSQGKIFDVMIQFILGTFRG